MWVLIDVIIWFSLHMVIVYICHKLPDNFYENRNKFYQPINIEADGKIYSQVFGIRKWKDKLPDGGKINKYGFEKSRLKTTDTKYYSKFIVETKRAELIHWLGLLSSLVFYFRHGLYLGTVIFVIAALLDIPFIMIQRFNRPRLEKLKYRMINK